MYGSKLVLQKCQLIWSWRRTPDVDPLLRLFPARGHTSGFVCSSQTKWCVRGTNCFYIVRGAGFGSVRGLVIQSPDFGGYSTPLTTLTYSAPSCRGLVFAVFCVLFRYLVPRSCGSFFFQISPVQNPPHSGAAGVSLVRCFFVVTHFGGGGNWFGFVLRGFKVLALDDTSPVVCSATTRVAVEGPFAVLGTLQVRLCAVSLACPARPHCIAFPLCVMNRPPRRLEASFECCWLFLDGVQLAHSPSRWLGQVAASRLFFLRLFCVFGLCFGGPAGCSGGGSGVVVGRWGASAAKA